MKQVAKDLINGDEISYPVYEEVKEEVWFILGECRVFVLTRRRKIITLILVDSLLLIAANSAAVNFMEPFVAIPIDLILISSGLSIVFIYYMVVFQSIH